MGSFWKTLVSKEGRIRGRRTRGGGTAFLLGGQPNRQHAESQAEYCSHHGGRPRL